MNKIITVDAYDTSRIMARLLMRARYEPVNAESIEIEKIEAASRRGYRNGNAFARRNCKRVAP